MARRRAEARAVVVVAVVVVVVVVVVDYLRFGFGFLSGLRLTVLVVVVEFVGSGTAMMDLMMMFAAARYGDHWFLVLVLATEVVVVVVILLPFAPSAPSARFAPPTPVVLSRLPPSLFLCCSLVFFLGESIDVGIGVRVVRLSFVFSLQYREFLSVLQL